MRTSSQIKIPSEYWLYLEGIQLVDMYHSIQYFIFGYASL